MLTWGLEGNLHCFDLYTGKEIWTSPIAPSRQLITCLPNATGSVALVFGGWDERPRVIDCSSGLTIVRLPKEMKDVESGAISSDGSLVALVATDSSVTLFDARSGQVKGRLVTQPPSRLYKTAFSPDGSSIAATAGNGTAIVWKTADGVLQNVLAKRQYVNDNAYLTFLPDGQRIVLETGKDQTSIVDISTSDNVVTIQRSPGVGGVVSAIASRDGSLIALSSLGRVTVHETATGVMMYEMNQVDYYPSLSPDGSRIAIRTSESVAGVYEISPATLQADSR